MERIEIIKSKLEKLREHDKKIKVFGASSHKYISSKVPETDIERFEVEFSISLPFEFKSFLMEIGYGAGPNYGIYSIKQIESELSYRKDDFSKSMVLNKPFRYNNKDTQDYIELKKNGVTGYYYKTLTGMEGWLPICTHGCTYYSILVISGEQSGKIWDMNEDGYQILPAGVTEELTFFDWYEKWLDDQLSKDIEADRNDELINENPQRVKSIVGPKLDKVPFEQMLKCTNLESLSLTYNELVALPRATNKPMPVFFNRRNPPRGIEEFKNLKMLFLSNNKIDKFPEDIVSLEQLSYLDLSHNQIEYIQDDTLLPRNLKVLDISYNKLNTFSSSLGAMALLEQLKCQNNCISSISSGIKKLESLKYLNFSSNKLSIIPEEIGELKNLQTFDLSENQVQKLPNGISNLHNLHYLCLSNNPIEKISPVEGLRGLLKIDLNNCSFKTFPEEILKSQNLKMLEIRNNSFTCLPKNISDMAGIISLDLGRIIFNDLEETIELLFGMPNLRDLTISYSVLHELPSNIIKLRFLDTLVLYTYLDIDEYRRRMTGYDRIKQEEQIKAILPNTYVNLD